MTLSGADKELIKLMQQMLRLGSRPGYVDKLRGLVKGGDPEGISKKMVYAVQLYRFAYEYERGDDNCRGFFHSYLAVLDHLSILPHLNGLWLNYQENADFSQQRNDKDELKAVAEDALRDVDYERINAYQESDLADNIEDIKHNRKFKCPSGWIIEYEKRFYIIKRQKMNCNLLFRKPETTQEKEIRQEIIEQEDMWKDFKSFDLAKLVEIDKDNDLVVRESPTYVLPNFEKAVADVLRTFGREYTHATKTSFLSYVHKSESKALKGLIESKDKAWKISVEKESRNNDKMKSDLKRLYEFYRNKSGGKSTATSIGREKGERDIMEVEEAFV